jgi:hypothetical protein
MREQRCPAGGDWKHPRRQRRCRYGTKPNRRLCSGLLRGQHDFESLSGRRHDFESLSRRSRCRGGRRSERCSRRGQPSQHLRQWRVRCALLYPSGCRQSHRRRRLGDQEGSRERRALRPGDKHEREWSQHQCVHDGQLQRRSHATLVSRRDARSLSRQRRRPEHLGPPHGTNAAALLDRPGPRAGVSRCPHHRPHPRSEAVAGGKRGRDGQQSGQHRWTAQGHGLTGSHEPAYFPLFPCRRDRGRTGDPYRVKATGTRFQGVTSRY